MIDTSNAMYSLNKAQESDLVSNLKNKHGKDSKASDAQLREQTDKFEAILLKTLLDTSLNLDNDMYPKQPGGDIYNSMYKDALANSLSGSFGYSELLFNFLKEQQKLQ